MARIALLTAVAVSMAITACATGEGGPANNGNIAVETASQGRALEGAQCVATSAAGRWDLTTPAMLPAAAATGDLRVLCNKPGYRSSEFVYRPSPYGSYGNPNVGLGVGGGSGNVGVGLGFSFPIGGARPTGAYPERVVVEMQPQ